MIRNFENFNDLSTYIKEEIDLGIVKPFDIKNKLYKSGDYTCSSFTIDDREVIVSSIVIPNNDIKVVNGGRNYKYLSDYLKQFGIQSDYFLYVGFMEYKDGKYNEYDNVNDTTTLFRKMETIVDIIRDFINYHNVEYVIYNSVENDIKSGLSVDYKKRDKFYELYLTYNNVYFKKIKPEFDINGDIISDFYLLNLNI
jgi:hypothetical protein